MQKLGSAAVVVLVLLSAGCPREGENAFKDSRPEFMQEMKAALAKADIPFREDKDGFIRYPHSHERAVNELRASLNKELQSGVAWKLDDEDARGYLTSLLASMGLKYRVERQDDADWIRWYPANEGQVREVGQKLAEYLSTRALKKKGAK